MIGMGLSNFLYRKLYSLRNKVNGWEIKHLTDRMNVGENFRLCRYPKIDAPEKIFVEDNVIINEGVTIMAHGGVEIGEWTMISTNVAIITVNHDYSLLGKDAWNSHIVAPVKIGRNVWIGSNAVILPGVTIGDMTIIGAGSVVTKDIPANSIAVGNPARVVRKRFE